MAWLRKMAFALLKKENSVKKKYPSQTAESLHGSCLRVDNFAASSERIRSIRAVNNGA